MARVIIRKRNVQSPVNSVTSSMGLALSPLGKPWNASHAARVIHAIGARQARKTTGFRIHQRLNFAIRELVISAQVHPGVQLRNLVRVTVERQRRPLEELTDATLACLAPPGMVDIRIDVRVEAVLLSSLLLPGIDRLFVREANINDGFDSLETILPRNYKTKWCAVLIRQWFSIDTRSDDRERVRRFIHAQAFHVGPVQHFQECPRLFGVLLRIDQCFEFYELG